MRAKITAALGILAGACMFLALIAHGFAGLSFS